MTTSVIGIDCATQPKKIGLTLGRFMSSQVSVLETSVPANSTELIATLTTWVQQNDRTLLALDAPLGWPATMGITLGQHQAGEAIKAKPDRLFHRTTDAFIQQKLSKKPLEVGANLIARTAHAALELLNDLRDATGQTIPLAWEPELPTGTFAIEVYPAATLIASQFNLIGYKKKAGMEARKLFFQALKQKIELPNETTLIEQNMDVLDSVICVLAGADFLHGDVYEPSDHTLAQKEGWIWVRKTHGEALK